MNAKKIVISLWIVFTITTLPFFANQLFAHNNFAFQKKKTPPKGEKVISDPDIPALFSGGTAEMHRFIANTLRYPAEAVRNNSQGLVVYTFIVEKDGTLSNFEIMHRADSLLNQEALRILQLMPPWRPAKFKDEIVRSKTYVPMYFRLNKEAVAAANRSASPSGACPTTPTPRALPTPTATTATSAQTNTTSTSESKMESTETEVFSIVNKMPRYYNGDKALAEFISKQIRYPIEARQQGIEGRIICSFVVGIDGSISNIEVVQGLNPQLDNEAMRVLGLMPKWIPGENNGEKVNVKCLLPIDFAIDEEPIPPFNPQEEETR